MADRDWVVCSPWSQEALTGLPGNRTDECSSCHEPVVIGTSGQAMVAKGALILCIPCAVRDHGDQVPQPAPGALEALEAAGYEPSARIVRLAREGLPLREYPR